MKAEIGSISSGTMRPQDLCPVFWELLKDLEEWSYEAEEAEKSSMEIPVEWPDDDDSWWNGETCGYILDELFNRLNAHSPVCSYFGAHPGDGADYGFWVDVDAIEYAVKDDEILGVSDLADAPEFVLVTNDHGNMTLYETKFKELWSIV